jgi:TatD DNase family protein
MPVFYDTHAHLDYPDFAGDIGGVIDRAAAAGIEKIISIGTDLESSARAVDLAGRFPGVYAVVGWHPCQAAAAPADLRPALRELARHPKVVALGETGLDYHRAPDDTPEARPADPGQWRRKQAEVFRQHLEVAAESGLNCVIHQRDALEDVLGQVKEYASRVRGVFHCFVDDAAAMGRILDLGSLVSFTGIVTFKNAASVRHTLEATPLDRFMLETDCPYLAPVPYRGKRCEPAYVREIALQTAQTKGCSLEDLSRATCATARQFFPKLD